MVVINYNTREVSCKIVFYGPGLSGKTTNLQYIHSKVPGKTKGDLISLATDADRTLYFDFLPINIGDINGFTTKFQIYTVPGQVFYNATRKLVLRGVDGIIFVADSQRAKADENVESLNNLKENLAEYGLELSKVPIVMQYNKRDLPDVMSIDELNKLLNEDGWPVFEAAAPKGVGVFDTLKLVIKLVLDRAKKAPVATDSKQSQRVEDAQLPVDDSVVSTSPTEEAEPVSTPEPESYQTASDVTGNSEEPAQEYGALAASAENTTAGETTSSGNQAQTGDGVGQSEPQEVSTDIAVDVEIAEAPAEEHPGSAASKTDRIPVIRENQVQPQPSMASYSDSEVDEAPETSENADTNESDAALYRQLPSMGEQSQAEAIEDDEDDEDDEDVEDSFDNNGDSEAFSVPTMRKSVRQKRRKKKGFFLFRWLFRRG
jgi:signal recognition particle receptor subunit beta